MVPRAFRNKVIVLGVALLFFFVLVGAFGVYKTRTDFLQVKGSDYSAADHALDLAVLDGIVKASHSVVSDKDSVGIKAVIVPHHLVAGESIALGIQMLASSSPKIIVVLSPDHFGQCSTLLCTTRGRFETFFGNVVVDEKSVITLLHSSDIIQESTLFKKEHGIYTILPFIKHYIPQALIVPVVISQNGRGTKADREEMKRILELLVSRKDVALVVSTDFSHYLPLVESNMMDSKTQNSFCSGNEAELVLLNNPKQSDCPLCLWFAEQEAKHLGFWNPHIIAHTNSATILHDISVKETTSHFAIALSSSVLNTFCPVSTSTAALNMSAPSSQVTIIAVGDMTFDRYIRQVSNKKGEEFLFSCVDPLLKKADLVIGNLEGPITALPSTSMGTRVGSPENYYFTFPTTTASLLFRHNIKLVNIGNNHINNQGREGMVATRNYLKDAGVSYIGGLAGDEALHVENINGMNIAFVSYNQFNGDSSDTVAKIVKEEHATGKIVIVYAHWGDEYVATPEYVKQTARLFAESGADIVIGSHPHIVLSYEMIGNTIVYYSLGNFIFDQYFEPRVMNGLALAIHITKGKIGIEEIPVTLGKDGRTCPASH